MSDFSTPASTPRRNRRGDIHPSLLTSPLVRRGQAQAGAPGSGIPDSSQPGPQSSAAPLLSVITPSDGPDVTRVLWGTSVNVQDALVSFMDFLRNFKVKYRRAYDRVENVPTRAMRDPLEGERKQYEDYLRKMRVTQQTTLNLDMTNMMAYPGTKKDLYPWLIKYPQEIVPIMDIGLKDVMLTLAEDDGADEMEMKWLEDAPFRVRPFGGKIEVNMRDLNPGGGWNPRT